jgi:hypothetical protein
VAAMLLHLTIQQQSQGTIDEMNFHTMAAACSKYHFHAWIMIQSFAKKQNPLLLRPGK